jgi:hypothetical protein
MVLPLFCLHLMAGSQMMIQTGCLNPFGLFALCICWISRSKTLLAHDSWYTSLQLLEVCVGVEVFLLGNGPGLPYSSCWLVLINFWWFFGRLSNSGCSSCSSCSCCSYPWRSWRWTARVWLWKGFIPPCTLLLWSTAPPGHFGDSSLAVCVAKHAAGLVCCLCVCILELELVVDQLDRVVVLSTKFPFLL